MFRVAVIMAALWTGKPQSRSRLHLAANAKSCGLWRWRLTGKPLNLRQLGIRGGISDGLVKRSGNSSWQSGSRWHLSGASCAASGRAGGRTQADTAPSETQVVPPPQLPGTLKRRSPGPFAAEMSPDLPEGLVLITANAPSPRSGSHEERPDRKRPSGDRRHGRGQ